MPQLWWQVTKGRNSQPLNYNPGAFVCLKALYSWNILITSSSSAINSNIMLCLNIYFNLHDPVCSHQTRKAHLTQVFQLCHTRSFPGSGITPHIRGKKMLTSVSICSTNLHSGFARWFEEAKLSILRSHTVKVKLAKSISLFHNSNTPRAATDTPQSSVFLMLHSHISD